VGIDLRRGHICVAQQLLHRANVVAVGQHVGGKRVSERRVDRLRARARCQRDVDAAVSAS
jgi:hypothetical protein